jgi:hypothetical protein
MIGLQTMTNPLHYHVSRHNEDDVAAFTTIFDAVGYAGVELARLADHENDMITAHGEARQFEDAWKAFKRTGTYNALALNAQNIERQYMAPPAERAPLYQDDENFERLKKAAIRVAQMINSDTPTGFLVSMCASVECAPTEDEGE